MHCTQKSFKVLFAHEIRGNGCFCKESRARICIVYLYSLCSHFLFTVELQAIFFEQCKEISICTILTSSCCIITLLIRLIVCMSTQKLDDRQVHSFHIPLLWYAFISNIFVYMHISLNEMQATKIPTKTFVNSNW